MESEAVAAARRQLAALSAENRERVGLATQRMQENDARVQQANAEQRSSIQKLVKRLRESAANRERLERENKETYAFGRKDEAEVGSARRWPGSTPESRQRREDALAKQRDRDTQQDGYAPQQDSGHRKMRSWEQSWHGDGEQSGSPEQPPVEHAEQPRRRPERPRRDYDDEDMSGQSWMG